jgi:trimeric autotransporter adhesin
LAAVDRTAGLATSWQLPANDAVMTLFDDGRRLYVGGLFTTIGGERRSRLAAVDKATGLLTRWSPDANALVRTIVVSGGRVFVGGDFTTVNGASRRALTVLSAETREIVGE